MALDKTTKGGNSMDSVIISIVLGFFIIALGISNRKGNISSVHWYHRTRVTEENRVPFGRMIGLGTIIIGISFVVFGVLALVTEITHKDIFIGLGAAAVIVGTIVGIALSVCAMFKYNKGIV